jgi:N-methylhydantoinase A
MNLASELMIKAIQEVTIAEGFNPRESTLVAGGGAAGINILPIARELGCERLVLPKVAAALSASGMQFADIVKEETGSLVTTTSRFDRDGVNRLLSRLEDKLRAFMRTLGARAEAAHSRGTLSGAGMGAGHPAALRPL